MELTVSMTLFYAIFFTAILFVFKLISQVFVKFTPAYKQKVKSIKELWEHVIMKTNQLYDICLPIRGVTTNDRSQIRELRITCGEVSQLGLSVKKEQINYLYNETNSIYLKWSDVAKKQYNAAAGHMVQLQIENEIFAIQRDLLRIKEML